MLAREDAVNAVSLPAKKKEQRQSENRREGEPIVATHRRASFDQKVAHLGGIDTMRDEARAYSRARMKACRA